MSRSLADYMCGNITANRSGYNIYYGFDKTYNGNYNSELYILFPVGVSLSRFSLVPKPGFPDGLHNLRFRFIDSIDAIDSGGKTIY